MVDERLTQALDGVELTEREERYLKWLSRMDGETIEVFAGLFEKVRKHPLTERYIIEEKPED